MGTPFTTTTGTAPASVISSATLSQIGFISRLIDERDWRNAGPAASSFVTRTACINVVIGWVTSGSAVPVEVREYIDPEASDGENVNRLMARLIRDAREGEEYAWKPLTKEGASKLIDWLLSLPKIAANTAGRAIDGTPEGYVPSAEVVPAGRYAIDTADGATNAIAFYKVDRPTEGRWAGYVFVKLMVSDDEQRIPFAAAKGVLAKIAEVGAEVASARYGHEIGECGICGRTLTNDESRARGIGPVCAAKAGW